MTANQSLNADEGHARHSGVLLILVRVPFAG